VQRHASTNLICPPAINAIPRFHDFGLTASIRHIDREDFGPARDLIEAAKGSRARQAVELQSGADKNICRTERIA
jgi:hypothetical protein